MNTPQHNMEFQLAWCESNLQWLYGNDQNNSEVKRNIVFMESEIERLKIALNITRF